MQYRLLKDIPGVPAGLVFEETDFLPQLVGQIYSGYKPKGRTSPVLTGSLVEENPEWFAPVDGRWTPVDGLPYFFLNSFLEAVSDCWLNFSTDERRFNAGNIFKTQEQAESAAERIKALLLDIHKENA